jgi:hypothetical protein
MQHTKPVLTWDEDSVDRKRVLRKKVTADLLKEEDFKAYLASESESSASEDDVEGDDVGAIRARCASYLILLSFRTVQHC